MFRYITGELQDPAQETRFLAAAWPRTRLLVRILFGITSLVIVGMIYANVTIANFNPNLLYILVPLRVIQAASYFSIFLLSFRRERPAIYPYAISATQLATLCAEASNNGLAVLPYAASQTPPMPFFVVILFAYYTLVPSRFGYTIAFGVITSAVYCTLAAIHYPTIGYLVLMFAFVNLIGISYGRYINRLQRQDFLSRQELERESAQRRIAQTEAVEAQKAAESASSEKSRFIAVASHDLRQPLHAMGLWIDTLTDQLDDTPHPELARTVSHLTIAKESLDGLLDRLLHASHLDSGTTVVRPEPLEVGDVLERLHSRFAEAAPRKDIRFRTRSQSVNMVSDPVLIARILDNLTDNAIKYTPRGGRITVGARRTDTAVRIQVWNTGIQIPPAELDHIFEEFHQANQVGAQDFRGLGLGLSIVKRLCQLMDHEVAVRSVTSGTTLFELTVKRVGPVSAAPTPAHRPISRYDSLDTAVLVIDDDPEILEGMARLLTRWGARASVASDRNEALAQFATQPPDIIITDQHLAHGDKGIDVVQRLLATSAQQVPVLLMTGETSSESLIEVAATGYRYLTKPVKPARLRMVIDQIMSESS